MKKCNNVLLIDDDPISNFISYAIMQRMGVGNIRIASNGLNALQYLIEDYAKGIPLPDLLIVDIHMPVMDGFEFLSAYEESVLNKEGTKIVMVSTLFNSKDIEVLNQKEICFLDKPLTQEKLALFLGKPVSIVDNYI